MIFQDPYASLNPRQTVGQILAEPFRIHDIGSPADQRQSAMEILSKVGLRPSQINRYPHEFSGGQRQRITIGRAIALSPDLVIADEPVSALDVSIQAQILNLMRDLQDSMNLSYLFISHDLTVIEHMCDVIAVMYLGKFVEVAPKNELFNNPCHPYTQGLIATIPKIGSKAKSNSKKVIGGEIPNPINPPTGCAFHPRCPHAMPICKTTAPNQSTISGGSEHHVACWLHQEHNERG